MLTLRVVCFFSAFMCVAAHAQNCSGGADGGIDASGNQCSAAGNTLDSAQGAPVIARPAAAIATARQPRATATASRSTGATARGPQIVAASPPVDRFLRSAKPPAETVRSAKMENSHEASCSGGTDGGMDATGNQCSPAGFADGVVVALVPGR